jgi:hypothetical protein
MLSAVLAIMLLSVAVAPVLAVPPVHTIVHFEGAYDPIDCGDFIVLAEYVTDARISTFFDRDGIPATLHVQVPIEFTITNTATGESVSEKHHYLRIFDFETGTHTFVGLLASIAVPGKGVVVLDAGRFIADAYTVPSVGEILWRAGPHDILDKGNVALCDAFE